MISVAATSHWSFPMVLNTSVKIGIHLSVAGSFDAVSDRTRMAAFNLVFDIVSEVAWRCLVARRCPAMLMHLRQELGPSALSLWLDSKAHRCTALDDTRNFG